MEGILVHATSSTFAGRRNNVSLGRSEVSVAGLVPMQAVAPMTAGVLWKKEEGNVVGMREAHALDASMPKKQRRVRADTSFTRSRDPCTSIGILSSGVAQAATRSWELRVGNPSEVSRQSGIAVGKTCASRRNRHRGHG